MTWPKHYRPLSHSGCARPTWSNITMCAAISEHGVSTHIIGSGNTQHLLTFLDTIYRHLIPETERDLSRHDLPNFVIVWDSMSIQHPNVIRVWFAVHQKTYWCSSLHYFLHSWIQAITYFLNGGRKYIIRSDYGKMLIVVTSQNKIAGYGFGM